MKIVHIIPIGRGISAETLSYFSALPVTLGALVSVPLRKKMVPGIVTSLQELGEMRSEIKNFTFGMRKVDKILSPHFFSEAFMRSAERAADYFATTTGAVISALSPVDIIKNADAEGTEMEKPELMAKGKPPKSAIFILQGDEEKRLSEYKTLIREEFAKKHSVYCCVPTTEDAKRYFSFLSKGVEPHAFLLHGGVSKKEMEKRWKESVSAEHPVLIVATGGFLSLRRDDIGAIIIEKESSRAYRTRRRPFLDIRICAELYAKELGARLILSDMLLRTETLWREQSGEAAYLSAPQWKLFTRQNEMLVDMKKEKIEGSGKFSVLGDMAVALIKETEKKKLHSLFFAVRKGYAPSVVCQDCGAAIRCTHCFAPVVFYKSKGTDENIFFCQKCKTRREADHLCEGCGSWRLMPLGVGIDRAYEEIQKHIPEAQIFLFDRDSVKTEKEAEKIMKAYLAAPFAVLLCTEMALLFLHQKIDHAVIVSADSLFSIPDFRMNEKIMGILLKIRELASGAFIIQTRDIGQNILGFAKEGNIIDFYRQEIAERKKYNYPPFLVPIKISLSGEKTAVEKEMEKLATLLHSFGPEIFPGFGSAGKKGYAMHALIRVPRERWPEPELLKILRSLPRFYLVQVDPESLIS